MKRVFIISSSHAQYSQATPQKERFTLPKVVHVVYSGLGGIANVFFSLASADLNDEWEHCVVFYGVEPLVDAHGKQCIEMGIQHTFIQRLGRLDRKSIKSVSKWLTLQKPDAVIVHLPRALPAAIAYKKQIPHVRIIGVEHNPISVKRLADWFDSWSLDRHCDAVVYLSNNYFSAVRGKLGKWFKGKNAHVIPNGLDVSKYSPCAKHVLIPNTLRFGMCARLANTKDIGTLIRSIAHLNTRFPDHHFQLTLAGTGPEQKNLENLCHTLEIEEQVEFSGFLNEQELIDWFHSLDIYTHATLAEAMSTSVMQAMACGLPVVASDVSGMDELVPPCCGKLVPTNQPEELASAIAKFVTEPSLLASKGQKSREHAKKHLSRESSWLKYRELLS